MTQFAICDSFLAFDRTKDAGEIEQHKIGRGILRAAGCGSESNVVESVSAEEIRTYAHPKDFTCMK